jgi:hypothetical protein
MQLPSVIELLEPVAARLSVAAEDRINGIADLPVDRFDQARGVALCAVKRSGPRRAAGVLDNLQVGPHIER